MQTQAFSHLMLISVPCLQLVFISNARASCEIRTDRKLQWALSDVDPCECKSFKFSGENVQVPTTISTDVYKVVKIIYDIDCIDIDECATRNHACHDNGDCFSTDGSYSCACKAGYIGDGYICADIDECATSNHVCHSNGTCFNTDGSHECTCNTGYEGDGFTCKDIDECATRNRACHANGDCFNTDGSYECTCKAGYIGDGFTCTDIDECTTNDHGCHVNGDCYNTDGSYACTCNTGYEGDGFTCEDIDECATNDNDCHVNGTCSNTDGSYECTCNTGYEGDGFTCEDINECATNDHGCHVNGTCYNTDGSYKCTCNTGYSGDGLTCEAYCPVNWIFRNSYCYFFNHTARSSFEEAQSQCQDLEAELISIHSQDEQNFTASNAQRGAFPASPDNWWDIGYWIGFNDVATEGAYVWTDGTTVDYTSWLEGQPNDNNRDQDCVGVGWKPADGLMWHDVGCSYAYAYICKKS